MLPCPKTQNCLSGNNLPTSSFLTASQRAVPLCLLYFSPKRGIFGSHTTGTIRPSGWLGVVTLLSALLGRASSERTVPRAASRVGVSGQRTGPFPALHANDTQILSWESESAGSVRTRPLRSPARAASPRAPTCGLGRGAAEPCVWPSPARPYASSPASLLRSARVSA